MSDKRLRKTMVYLMFYGASRNHVKKFVIRSKRLPARRAARLAREAHASISFDSVALATWIKGGK